MLCVCTANNTWLSVNHTVRTADISTMHSCNIVHCSNPTWHDHTSPALCLCSVLSSMTLHATVCLSKPLRISQCSFASQVQATAAGTAHAIIMWWKLNLDQSGHITLDTAPSWTITPAEAASLPDSVPKADANVISMEHTELGGAQSGTQTMGRQPEQQWRDHWKQCWTPVQPHLTLGRASSLLVRHLYMFQLPYTEAHAISTMLDASCMLLICCE